MSANWQLPTRRPATAEDYRRYITIGVDPAAGTVHSIRRDLLYETTVAVRGVPKSGKTSTALLPLAMQLMRTADPTDCEQVIFIDLGGDLSLANSVRFYAQSLGWEFRLWTPKVELASAYFDPFQGLPQTAGSELEAADGFLQALALDHGKGYGPWFYTSMAYLQFFRLARLARQELGAGRTITFADIARHLSDRRNRVKDAHHVRALIEILAEFDRLYPAPPGREKEAIDFRTAFSRGRQVAYFYMPGISHSVMAGAIAGLVLFNLHWVAQRRAESREPLRRAWVFIDEAHELASRSFSRYLVHIRKLFLQSIVAYHYDNQWLVSDSQGHEALDAAANLKLYFSTTGPEEIRRLQAMSTTTRIYLKSFTDTTGHNNSAGSGQSISELGGLAVFSSHAHGQSWSTAESRSEHIVATPDQNEIVEVNGTQNAFFYIARTTEYGPTPPTRLQGQHVIHPQVHQELRQTGLPLRSSEPVPPKIAPPVPSRIAFTRDSQRQKQMSDLAAAVERSLDIAALPQE